MKDRIKEELKKLVTEKEGAPSNDEETTSSDNKQAGNYENIRSALDNELINHAAVIRGLWGDSDATKRSEFRKKLSTDPENSAYSFTEEEIGKIETILTTFRDDLGGELTKEKKGEEE